jgi:hypothetical protein
MKMMFFCLILLTVAAIYNSAKLSSRPLEIDDNPFYDDDYFLKKKEIKKLKEEVQHKIADKLTLSKSKIRNFEKYIRNNKINFISSAHSVFNLTTKGSCNKILNLADIYQSVNNYTSTFNYTENILNFQSQLNDKNTIFDDEYGNLIIFSFCSDLFSLKCQPKFFFLNKLNFEFYEFTLSGEKIPKLSGFALDYLLDKNLNNKKYIYLFGGIDNKGVHNSDLYRFEIDYSFGNIKIKRMGVEIINTNHKEQRSYIPAGVSENSLNILSFIREDRESYHSVISYGGINDENISNKLSVYNPISNTWSEINSVLSSKGIYLQKRKGHSSIIINSEDLKFPISLNRDSNNLNLNKSLMKIYYMLIFGGKSETDYHNDLIIIKISYMTLDDIFYYELLENNSDYKVDGDLPSPREGHRVLLKDEYMYIQGGCDYSRKKCYNNKDMLYRLNLRTTPMLWEKVDVDLIDTQGEEFSFDDKNLNLQYFNNEMINIGSCNSFFKCDNSIKILLTDVNCKCRNVFIGERTDFIPFSNVFKNNNGAFNMTEAIEEWSGKVNLKTLIEVPIPKMNNLFCTEMDLRTLNKLKENEFKKLEKDLFEHFKKFNMTGKISHEEEKKPIQSIKNVSNTTHKNTSTHGIHNKTDNHLHEHENKSNKTHHKHNKNNHTLNMDHSHNNHTSEHENGNEISILEGLAGAGVLAGALNGKNSHDKKHGKDHGKFNKTKTKNKNHKHKHKNHKNKTLGNSNKTDHTLKNGIHNNTSTKKHSGKHNVVGINLFESLNGNSTVKSSNFDEHSHHHKKKKFWKSKNKTKISNETHTNKLKEPKKKGKKGKKHHNKTISRFSQKHFDAIKNKTLLQKSKETTSKLADHNSDQFMNLDLAEMINRALKVNLEPILKENENLRKSLLNKIEMKSSPIKVIPTRISFIQLSKNHSHNNRTHHHKNNYTHHFNKTDLTHQIEINSLHSNVPDHKKISTVNLHNNTTFNNKTEESNLKGLKDYMKQLNTNSEKEIMSLLKVIMKDIEYVKTNTTKKIDEIQKISKLNKNNEVNTGSTVITKCVNGHLLK